MEENQTQENYYLDKKGLQDYDESIKEYIDTLFSSLDKRLKEVEEVLDSQ